MTSRPPKRPLPYKPQVVLDYNRCMGGVDLKDQMLEPYLLERKRCAKWYLKLFKRLLNCSINNARILLESSNGARRDNLSFRLQLVDAIINRHHHLIPINHRYHNKHIKSRPLTRYLDHAHWLVRIPQSSYELAMNRQGRQKCVVCQKAKKISRTPYMAKRVTRHCVWNLAIVYSTQH